MSNESRRVFAGTLKHARTAALVASLVPLAQVAVAPTSVLAQCDPSGSDPCPPVGVPEPGTLALLAPAAAAALLLRRRKK
jgi:hypothetical protein